MAEVCPYHARFFSYPCSLVGRHIGIEDIYQDREDWRQGTAWGTRWPTLSLQPAQEVFYRPFIRVVINGETQKPRDPFRDKDWGTIEAARRLLFADRDSRPKPGKPNRLSTAAVIQPDGSVIKTVPAAPTNSQHTGAFVLWKGYGKKKIRKSQRMRPQGWHGNHPEQKPRERWGTRDTLDKFEYSGGIERIEELLKEAAHA